MAALYADEDFPYPVVERLRELGHDVVTAFEAGQANRGIEDADQLAFATNLARAILTRNRKDYIQLHRRFVRHEGIVSVTDHPNFSGKRIASIRRCPAIPHSSICISA